MFRSVTALAIASGLCLPGCTRSIPKPASGPAGVARVGWVVMIGDRDNPDRDFVCYSESPGDCVMPPSRPDGQVFAAVHLYYHPAATETKYAGTIQIGFFSTALDLKPDFTVKPNASPGNQGIVGIVSAKPGTYPFTIAVDATPTAVGAPSQIRQQVQVVVR
ncbi:MAG: hypothetical protein ABI868_02885 [Acidobacteriota bacterium]